MSRLIRSSLATTLFFGAWVASSAPALAGGTTVIHWWSSGASITHISPLGHDWRRRQDGRHVFYFDRSEAPLVAYPRARGNRLAFPTALVDQGGEVCPGSPWNFASVGGRLAMIKHCPH